MPQFERPISPVADELYKFDFDAQPQSRSQLPDKDPSMEVPSIPSESRSNASPPVRLSDKMTAHTYDELSELSADDDIDCSKTDSGSAEQLGDPVMTWQTQQFISSWDPEVKPTPQALTDYNEYVNNRLVCLFVKICARVADIKHDCQLKQRPLELNGLQQLSMDIGAYRNSITGKLVTMKHKHVYACSSLEPALLGSYTKIFTIDFRILEEDIENVKMLDQASNE